MGLRYTLQNVHVQNDATPLMCLTYPDELNMAKEWHLNQFGNL